jgi:hypothetical protein
VGDFQNAPFDRTVGVVELTLQRPGVLMGRLTAAKALPSGWQWKILEGAPAGTARRYGPSGWADEPCDTDNVSVASAVNPGDIVYFTWYSAGGRLQTTVYNPADDPPDGGVHGGLPLCPLPAGSTDMGSAGDLGSGPNDAGSPPAGDGGGLLGDGGSHALPGIHCNCELGGGRRSQGGASIPQTLLAACLAAACLAARRRRQKAQRTGATKLDRTD